MKRKVHPGSVVRSLMQAQNITTSELSRRTKIPQGTLSRIVNETQPTVSTEILASLALFFKIRLGQMYGTEPLIDDVNQALDDKSGYNRSSVVISPLCLILTNENYQSYIDGVLSMDSDVFPCPEECGPDTVVFKIENDAHAEFKPGQYVFADPDLALESNCDVLAHHDGALIVRRYSSEGTKRFLTATNPTWHQKLVVVESPTKIVGRIFLSASKH